MFLNEDALGIRALNCSDKKAYCLVLSDHKVSGSLRGEIRMGQGSVLLSTCSSDELKQKFDLTLHRTIDLKPCVFSIYLGAKNNFIGSIGSYEIDKVRVGLTYWLAASFQGRGFGTRVLKLYCERALQYFNRQRILANVTQDILASIRVLTKAGFLHSSDTSDPGFDIKKDRVLLEYSATH